MDFLNYLIDPDANDVADALAWQEQAQQELENQEHENQEQQNQNQEQH
jgi:hypothetical protein